MTEPEKNYGFMWALVSGVLAVATLVVCVLEIDDLIEIYGTTTRYGQSYKYMLLFTSLFQIFILFGLAGFMVIGSIGALVEEKITPSLLGKIIVYGLLFLVITGLVGQVAISILSWYWGMS